MLDSPELAHRLAEAGYRLAQRYSYDVRAGRLLEVFREVAGGRAES
jgi:glycosyltransferase involved in cell wall biosynthesis